MSLFSVDLTRCVRDGLCAQECPQGLIEMDKTGPRAVADAEAHCVNCGHCVAICPTGAFDLRTMAAGACEKLPAGWAGKPEQVAALIKGRRSIRNYSSKPVPQETFLQLLDVVRYAPTGVNSQQVKWLVVKDPAHLGRFKEAVIAWMRTAVEKKLPMASFYEFGRLLAYWDKGRDRIFRGAPNLLVAYAESGDPRGPCSCTIALSYAELLAPSLGLGTCWAGYVQLILSQAPELQRQLGVPEGHQSNGILFIGHPRTPFRRIPLRKKLDVRWS
jgi:nitroreductase/NAD-dependent dihydropyrimidine dehydrogenase PreA subunit